MNYEDFNEENVTNYAKVAGIICKQLTKSHQIDGEEFFEFELKITRLSGQADFIPVTISERILMGANLSVGDYVELNGEYRSYNKLVSERSKLILHFFAKSCLRLEEEKNVNEVKLVGFVCKEPIFRTTPFNREIADVLLAVNRVNYHKSDYIPCIMWGRNARFIANQPIGCKVQVSGRIQSRNYDKKLEDGSVETLTAYEVSCQNIMLLANVSKLPENAVAEEKSVVNLIN